MPLLRNRNKRGALDVEANGGAATDKLPVSRRSSSEDSTDLSRDEDLSLLSWLDFHQTEAESVADILKDEISTIKRRKIVTNEKLLENERKPEAVRLSKSIVTGFNDAISKAIKNLQHLGQTMVNELQQRYNLPDKWLETSSTVASLAGSEVTGPTFSRNYLQNKFLSSLDDGSRGGSGSDGSDARRNSCEKQTNNPNDIDEQEEEGGQDQTENCVIPQEGDSELDNNCSTTENDIPFVSTQTVDGNEGKSAEDEDIDMVPASDDNDDEEQQQTVSNNEESVSRKASSPRKSALKIKIKKEKAETPKADSSSSNSKNQLSVLLKVAKKEAMENSGSDTDGSGKTCVVSRCNLSQSEKSNDPASTSVVRRVKKEKLIESPDDKNKKNSHKNSTKKSDTPIKTNTTAESADNKKREVDPASPDETKKPLTVNAINDDEDLMDFLSAPDIDDCMTVIVSRSEPKINVEAEKKGEHSVDMMETAECDVDVTLPITDEDKLNKVKKKGVDAEDDKDKEEKSKERTRRSKEELSAMREVLDFSDSGSDTQLRRRKREARKKTAEEQQSTKTHKKTEEESTKAQKKAEEEQQHSTQARQESDKSWKDDPKLNELKAVVEIEKLDKSIQKTLNENKFVCLKAYQKMKKTTLELLEKHDSFSDDESVESDDSIMKLNKALKALTRNSIIRTRRHKKSGLLKKKSKKSKRKSGHDSDNESLLDDDEDDKSDDAKFNQKGTSFKKHGDDLNSCSESEDLSPGTDDEKDTRTRKSQLRKTRASTAPTTKKKYAKATVDSTSDSEGEDKKMVLGSDSDDSDSDSSKKKSDAVKKKSEQKSKKKPKSSDSDSDFIAVVRKKGAKAPIKKESGSDSGSTVDLSDQSDDDSDFKDPAPKRFRSKRNRDSSPEGGKKKKRRRKRIVEDNSDDSDKKQSNDSDIQEVSADDDEQGSSQKGRKNIRKIMSNKKLAKTTREAEKEEEERKKRLSEKQKLFNGLHRAPESDKLERLILDVDPDTKNPVIEVDPTIVRHLKPHQAEGIKFMYNACFESVSMIKQNKVPGGCILAHCMGLGKTLQSVAFTHTLLTNKIIGIKTVLIICPLSTVNNWFNEFKSWTQDADDLRLHKLYEAKNSEASRIDYLRTWQRRGGVGILHYDMFRMLADPKGKKKMKDNLRKIIKETLLDEPGPDIVICDEGHLLKNCKSMLTLAVSSIGTHRRIVLTGTPLQNNLVEYHTMMNFVKPNLLGTLTEFTNRFVNPIKNGQHADSTATDVSNMKRRAHVLHKKLEGCVQRCDYLILAPYLPPKYEYIININLSEKQEILYKHYLENVVDTDITVKRKNILKYYAELVKVWSHPIALTMSRAKTEDTDDDSDEAGSLKDFVVDSDEESIKSSDSGAGTGDEKVVTSSKRKTRAQAAVDPDPLLPDVSEVERLADKWWNAVFKSKNEMYDVDISGKLVVLQQILKTCESIGDKVLVFSQYLSSLDIIEEFLEDWDKKAVEEAKNREVTFPMTDDNLRWRRNLEYYRIDGSTKVSDRHRDCERFNKKTGQMTRAKLFLISTRAGGLGINLFGANRVVIFDASWNPSQDMQSIFRVYRFGQDKPCYIYRLIARGTMEEKILRRQITKLSLSSRVVDEHQIERHFKFDDVNEMYRYDEEGEKKTLDVPKDRLLADLLMSHEKWIQSYEEFDSLLENKADEGLTDHEKELAWEEYRRVQDNRGPSGAGADTVETFLKIKKRIMDKFPTASDTQLREAAEMAVLVIDKLRALIFQVNALEQSKPIEHEVLSSTYVAPLKAWLAELVTPYPPGTPLPVINENSRLAKPLPFHIDAPFYHINRLQLQSQQHPMHFNGIPQAQQYPSNTTTARILTQHRRNVNNGVPTMQYPRAPLPSMIDMQSNFRNIATTTLNNGPVNNQGAWNMIRPQNVQRQIPRDPLL